MDLTETADRIRPRVEEVRERLAAAAARGGRDASAVTLIAVTKTHGPEIAAAAVLAGLRDLAENRVQEAAAKIPAVQALLPEGTPAPAWHLIGPLQTNKAKVAASLFDTVQAIDSIRAAEALSRRAVQAERATPIWILLEVYFGDDPDRPGFRSSDFDGAVETVAALPGLCLTGLMTVAPLGWDASATRGVFTRLRELRDRLAERHPLVDLHQLSMGMSDDFEMAVEEGSTMVRLGRVLFGPREKR